MAMAPQSDGVGTVDKVQTKLMSSAPQSDGTGTVNKTANKTDGVGTTI